MKKKNFEIILLFIFLIKLEVNLFILIFFHFHILENCLANENKDRFKRKVVISEECFEKLENFDIIEKKNLFLEKEIRDLRELVRTYETDLSKNLIKLFVDFYIIFNLHLLK